MELYFMRHAQSANNVAFGQSGGDNGRVADPELTEMGEAQAKLLAQYVSQPMTEYDGHILDYQNRHGFGLTHLYCSLMIRAVETGRVVARACGLPLVGWLELHERGGIFLRDGATGELVGLPGNNRTFLTVRFPELVLPDEVGEAGWWNRPAESFEAATERARLVLDQLIARHGGTDDRVGFISHGGFFQAFTAVLFNIPYPLVYLDELERGARFGTNNVSISRFVFTERTIDTVYLNHTRHLPVEYLT